jgi:hypothetical protein
MHCRQTIQHRDEQLVVRLARPLKRELEGAAAEVCLRSTAALVREILVDWAAQRIAERTSHEATDLP